MSYLDLNAPWRIACQVFFQQSQRLCRIHIRYYPYPDPSPGRVIDDIGSLAAATRFECVHGNGWPVPHFFVDRAFAPDNLYPGQDFGLFPVESLLVRQSIEVCYLCRRESSHFVQKARDGWFPLVIDEACEHLSEGEHGVRQRTAPSA